MKSAVILAVMSIAFTSFGADSPLLLVELEHAFAQSVAEQGISPGFAKHLAEDGYIFQPQPTLGRTWHRTNSSPGRLLWEPELAVLSAAGDLGFTTGPWQYFGADDETKVLASGHYFSVWRKQADETWKVAADIGIRHDPQELAGIEPVLRSMAGNGLVGDPPKLVAAESSEAPPLAESIRVYRTGQKPFVGAEAVTRGWRDFGHLREAKVLKTATSVCGTLAYTLGTGKLRFENSSGKPAADASFLRVWERTDSTGWRLAAEVALPWPEADRERTPNN